MILYVSLWSKDIVVSRIRMWKYNLCDSVMVQRGFPPNDGPVGRIVGRDEKTGIYEVTFGDTMGTFGFREEELAPDPAAKRPSRQCLLPGCGKENDLHVKACWNCGNEL